MDLILHHMPTN